MPPNPVTRQNKSYSGTAANDNPNIRKNIKDKINGVRFFLLIIWLFQKLQHCKV